jgi:hypothetical protein
MRRQAPKRALASKTLLPVREGGKRAYASFTFLIGRLCTRFPVAA